MKLAFITFCLFVSEIGFSQTVAPDDTTHVSQTHFVDTTYISQYHSPTDLTTRVYSSVKYSRLRIRDRELSQSLFYRSNENLILGVGFSYNKMTFNLGIGIPSINKRDVGRKGKTKYLDAQVHYYLEKYVLDMWLNTYKGYFLSNPSSATSQPAADPSFPIRPDIHNTNISFSLTRILNNEKFSFRAAFAQDEWQKKSAGSVLIGGEYNMLISKGDSSYLPDNVKDPDFFQGYRLKKVSIFNMALNAGYGHTFVVKKHIFFTMVALGSVGLSYTEMGSADNTQSSLSNFTWNANYSGKMAVGYNSSTVYVGLSLVHAYFANRTPIEKGTIIQNLGNVRLNLVKRFVLKKPLNLPIVNKLAKKH